MDIVTLAKQTVDVLQPLMASTAGSLALNVAGSAIWELLKARLQRPEQQAVLEAVAVQPERASQWELLRGQLAVALEEDAGLREELALLLPRGNTQTMTVTGDGNKSAQVGGSGNSVQIS